MVTILIDLPEDIDKKIKRVGIERGKTAKSVTIVELIKERLDEDDIRVFFEK